MDAQVQVQLFDPNNGFPPLNGIDALLIRTVTHLNKSTVPKIPKSLQFIGTATSGSDHIDAEYFESKNVSVYDAKGCNARAVAEYVITAILLWSEERLMELQKLTFGIIGVGAAGSEVKNILSTFGLRTILYDPPKEKREPDFHSCNWQDILECDVVSFHVPLINVDRFSTRHLFSDEDFENRNFKLVINAARGGVVDENALIKAKNKGFVDDFILDVWENEPNFNPEIAESAYIASPHIAGYSEQAKLNASSMIVDRLYDFFRLQRTKDEKPSEEKNLEISGKLEYSLTEILNRLHPIKEYDAALRDLATRDDKSILFSKLRTDRPFRFEYESLRIPENILNKFETLQKLGIKS